MQVVNKLQVLVNQCLRNIFDISWSDIELWTLAREDYPGLNEAEETDKGPDKSLMNCSQEEANVSAAGQMP